MSRDVLFLLLCFYAWLFMYIGTGIVIVIYDIIYTLAKK